MFLSYILFYLDESTKIEEAAVIAFNVSVSSLKYKNVSFVEYVPVRFKSRRKKVDEPADIVMKISNPDPEISCWPLQVIIFLIFRYTLFKI